MAHLCAFNISKSNRVERREFKRARHTAPENEHHHNPQRHIRIEKCADAHEETRNQTIPDQHKAVTKMAQHTLGESAHAKRTRRREKSNGARFHWRITKAFLHQQRQ